MRRAAKMAFILSVGIVLLIIAGCEEENQLTVRRSRLVVLENVQLKVQLEGCKQENEQQKEMFEKELEEQRQGLEKEIKKQGKLLDKCLKEKRVLANNTAEYVQGRLDSIFKSVVDENVKLSQENKDLRAEIERLREQAGKSE